MNPATVATTRQSWAKIRTEIERHFGLLWQEPELPGLEVYASRMLADWLEGHGFKVDNRACGIPTAFVARKGSGAGPKVAILAEYDALPGTDNDAVPYRKPRGLNAGHACGHCHIGPANTGAAIAAAVAAEQLGLVGEIVLVGCPAEEILWGKIALFKGGVFEDVDVILTSHGDYQNGAISRPCQSVFSGELVFEGDSGHGGGVRKRNALDALELAVQAIERLRGHQFPDASVEHVVRSGGLIPNVTPSEARLWLSCRHSDYGRANEVYKYVVGVAEQAAMQTNTAVRHQFISGSRGYLPNNAMARMLQDALEIVGPPKWTSEGRAWMKKLCSVSRPDAPFVLDDELKLYDDGLMDPFGQDDGEVSWRRPLGRINWAYPTSVPLHNWALTALVGYEGSFPGPLMASEALAMTAVRLLQDTNAIDLAKHELDKRVEGITLPEPELGALRTFTEYPSAFWNTTWIE